MLAYRAAHKQPGLVGLYSFLFLPVCAVHRQSERRHTHACIHTCTHGQPQTHNTPPPSTAHTFLILFPLLMADAFCSLLFPFSLSLSAPPFPFQYPLSFSWLHMQSASLHSPHLPLALPPSLHSPPSLTHSLSLHLLSSLSSVFAARGHYLSHSGHVRWNGGVCSELKQREL